MDIARVLDHTVNLVTRIQGRGLLKDKLVLITGSDPGIGCLVAVLMMWEGADVLIVYLPEKDAQDTKKRLRRRGRGRI